MHTELPNCLNWTIGTAKYKLTINSESASYDISGESLVFRCKNAFKSLMV